MLIFQGVVINSQFHWLLSMFDTPTCSQALERLDILLLGLGWQVLSWKFIAGKRGLVAFYISHIVCKQLTLITQCACVYIVHIHIYMCIYNYMIDIFIILYCVILTFLFIVFVFATCIHLYLCGNISLHLHYTCINFYVVLRILIYIIHTILSWYIHNHLHIRFILIYYICIDWYVFYFFYHHIICLFCVLYI